MVNNRKDNQIEFIDFDQGAVYATVTIPSEGPQSIKSITGIYYHNPDSVFVIGRHSMMIVNEEGNVIEHFRINRPNSEIAGIDFSEYHLAPRRNRPFFYYPKQNELIIPTEYVRYDQWTIPEYYTGSIAA